LCFDAWCQSLKETIEKSESFRNFFSLIRIIVWLLIQEIVLLANNFKKSIEQSLRHSLPIEVLELIESIKIPIPLLFLHTNAALIQLIV